MEPSPQAPLAHRPLVDAFLARVEAARWLSPDAAMESLDADARRGIDERVDEHLAALQRHAPAPCGFSGAVEVVRGMFEAAGRWENAWTATAGGPYLDAVEHVGRVVQLRRLADQVSDEDWDALASDVSTRAQEGEVWQRTFPAPPGTARPGVPGVVCAQAHAQWLLAFGDDPERPSPWGPLFALWERGLWPLALPDATMIVYVPVLDGGRAVATPGRPGGNVPTRRPRSALHASPIPRLSALGCGPGPGLDPYELPTQPPIMLGGAIAPVQPFPRVAPDGRLFGYDAPPPPDPPKAPWYRRLFGLA